LGAARGRKHNLARHSKTYFRRFRTGITLAREDGADREVLRLCTRQPPADIMELSHPSAGPSSALRSPAAASSAWHRAASDQGSYISGIELFVDGGLAQV